MPWRGVPLREHIEALRQAEQRLADERHESLSRRLNESAHDRERIRGTLGSFIPRPEFDQATQRIGSLERTVARLYGGIAVIVLIAGGIGIILRYTVG